MLSLCWDRLRPLFDVTGSYAFTPTVADQASAQTKVELLVWLLRDNKNPERATEFSVKAFGMPLDFISDKLSEEWAALSTEEIFALFAPILTPTQATSTLPDGFSLT